MKKIYIKFILLSLLAVLSLANSACHKNQYPCPGLGKSNEADLSKFDEKGELKNDKKGSRINKSNGMVNKKNPKKLRAKKSHI